MASGGPSWQDFYDMWSYSAQVARPGLIINEGDVSDGYGRGTATVGTAIIGYTAGRMAANFLDGAADDDLTNFSHDRGVDRDVSVAAVDNLHFTRISNVLVGSIPTGTRIATVPDSTGQFVTFTTNAPITFVGGQFTGTVAATCSTKGSVGNVKIGTLTRILDSLFDTFTVTNDGAAGGIDEESDDDLRDETRAYPLSLRRGTVDAIIEGAKQTPGVARVSLTVDAVTGNITVYVADADGNSNAALAAKAQAVIDGPPAWRGAADNVVVVAGTLLSVNISVSLVVKSGASIAALTADVITAITNRLKRLNPGETLYVDIIETAAKSADPVNIVSCTVTSPAVSIAPTASQSIRAGAVTVGG